MPASSPGWMVEHLDLAALALGPAQCTCAAASRAQSCASMPPAPALMLTIALCAIVLAREHRGELHLVDGGLDGGDHAFGFLGRRLVARLLRRGRAGRARRRAPPRCFFQSSATARFCDCSLSSACAFGWSFQNSGAAARASISATRFSAESTSKTPSERIELGSEGRDALPQGFGFHAQSCSRKRGAGRLRKQCPILGRARPKSGVESRRGRAISAF